MAGRLTRRTNLGYRGEGEKRCQPPISQTQRRQKSKTYRVIERQKAQDKMLMKKTS